MVIILGIPNSICNYMLNIQNTWFCITFLSYVDSVRAANRMLALSGLIHTLGFGCIGTPIFSAKFIEGKHFHGFLFASLKPFLK